jgi:hypothetical protein
VVAPPSPGARRTGSEEDTERDAQQPQAARQKCPARQNDADRARKYGFNFMLAFSIGQVSSAISFSA